MNLKETKFRELLVASAREYSKSLPHDTPLCFSGGTDSATLLFSLLTLSKKPPIYTFQLGEVESSDVRAARKYAEHFKLDLHIVKCPQTEEQLLDDVRWYLKATEGDTRRAFLQNTTVFRHLCREMKKDGHHHAYVSMIADGIYGSGREANFARHRGGESAFREERKSCWERRETHGSFVTIRDICKKVYDIELIDFYISEDLAQHILSCDYDDIWNHGYKRLPINAFSDYFKQGAFVRKPSPMQLNARVREWHDTLNRKYRTNSVVSAYGRIYQELRG